MYDVNLMINEIKYICIIDGIETLKFSPLIISRRDITKGNDNRVIIKVCLGFICETMECTFSQLVSSIRL